MGTLPEVAPVSMYQVYSKAFAKSAGDLNKKDFADKYKHKITAKGKHDGISVEANLSDEPKMTKTKPATVEGYESADVKVDVPVDDMFKVSLKATAGNKAEVTTELKVNDNATLELTCVNPATDLKTTEIKGKLTYLDPMFSVEGTFGLFDGPARAKITDEKANKFATGTHGAAFAVAFDCPGVDGVTVGVHPAFALGTDGAPYINMPCAVGGGNKDFALAVNGGFKYAGGNLTPTGGGIATYFKVSDPLAFAVEVDKSSFSFDKFDKYKPAKEEEKFEFKAGGEYKLSDKTSLKLRATYNQKDPVVWDAALKSALDGKTTIACGVKCKATGAPQVAFTYNLE